MTNDVYHFRGKEEGGCVVIMGGVHGDEKVGVLVIEELKKRLPPELKQGEIFLVIGNPRALEANQRFVEVDLNRQYSQLEKIKNKPPEDLKYEEKRVLELLPILARADVLLDLHSTQKPSVPFVYTENIIEHLTLAYALQPPFIVSPQDDFRPIDLMSAADNYVDFQGGVGITFESGWQKEFVAADILQRVMYFLHRARDFVKIRVFDNLPEMKFEEPRHLNVYGQIIVRKNDFELAQDFNNFDFIKKDEILAYENREPIKVGRDSFIIFPRAKFTVHEPACYLGYAL